MQFSVPTRRSDQIPEPAEQKTCADGIQKKVQGKLHPSIQVSSGGDLQNAEASTAQLANLPTDSFRPACLKFLKSDFYRQAQSGLSEQEGPQSSISELTTCVNKWRQELD